MHQRLAPPETDADARRAGHAQGPWANIRLTRLQLVVCGALVVCALSLVLTSRNIAAALAIGAATFLYVGHMLFRSVLWLAGCVPSRTPDLARRDDELPIYSLIVPMYDEANIVGDTLIALTALDYPRERLDVIFALEHDDRRTIAAFRGLDLPGWCRIVLVPAGGNRTKPNACNEALKHVRGEFVVVYDAEDRPEPGQLREAVAAFDAGGETVACLQARLAPDNAGANFITRMFALDFCQWFDAMLTGLQRLGYPVPLGGTSNHFRGIM